MKTHFLRLKLSLAFGITSLLILGSIFVVTTPSQHVSALNNDGCSDSQINDHGDCRPIISKPPNGGCPPHTDDVPGHPGLCWGPVISKAGPPGTGGGTGNSLSCPDVVSPGYKLDCSTIPVGCPGSTKLSNTLDPNSALTCPYPPSITSWICPVKSCTFTDGNIVLTKGQTYADGVAASLNASKNKDPELECGTSSTILDWIMCPAVNLVNTGVRSLDNAITSLLEVDPKIVNENDKSANAPGPLYYQAWQSFRTISLAVVVVAALVMLIGQGLGFEVLDAYTIKKVMPRLVVAIIGIALSWQIIKWFVVFTNDLGFGVSSLIFYPFRGLHGINLGHGTSFIITLLSAGAILAMGIGILLSLAFTALLGLLMAFFVLVLRQLVIVVLIMAAPIAIACYILPNTQSVWKLWHESFSKALLMFPIIMAFLAVGKVFAEVSSQGDATIVGKIVAFVAYIIPYFLIPATFRFAGGALRTLGGFVNDRSNGVFAGLKKGRQARWKDRKARAGSGHLYNGNNRVIRGANKAASWAADPTSNAAYAMRKVPGFRGAGARVASQVEHARVAQSDKLVEELQKGGFNDKAYRFLSGSHEYDSWNEKEGKWEKKSRFSDSTTQKLKDAGLFNRAPQSITDFQTAAHIFGEADPNEAPTERVAATALHGNAGRLASLYKDAEMGKASIAAAGLIGLASHGFADSRDLAIVGNNLQGKKGEDSAFAATVLSHAQLAGARSRPDIKAGYGYYYEDGQFVSGVVAGPDGKGGIRADSLVSTLASQDMSGAKGGAYDDLAPTINDVLDLKIKGKNGKLKAANEITDLDRNQARYRADAVRDQLFQWASPYSTSSVDIKAKALKTIEDRGMMAEYRARQAAEAAQQRRGGLAGWAQGGGDPGAGPGGPAAT